MYANANESNDASIFLYKNGFTVPRDVTHIHVDPSVTVLPAGPFRVLFQLEEVVLMEGLREIGANAFHNCTSLEKIKYPSTLTVIGFMAFCRCTSLRKVALPEGLREIGAQAFSNCASLKEIEFPSSLTVIGYQAFCRCTSLREVVLPEGLLEIGMGAFNSCSSLKRINILSTLTVISGAFTAFSSCTSLEEVVLPEGLQNIGEDTFHDCTSLKKINFPSTLTVISYQAFRNCTSLREVVLQEGLREIGEGAFRGCISLKQINFPSTLTVISRQTFGNCMALKEVELCNGLREIGSHAFGHCCSLLCVNIPSSVTAIDERAFEDCNLLRNVAISSTSFRQEMFDRFTSIHAVECSLDMLKARFDELPLHRLCFCYPDQSMGTTTLGQLSAEVNKYEQTKIISQDCLGMTPLHILASSGKHDVELFTYWVENCPDALIIKDKWGETPLKYALLSEAPLNVVIFLLGKHCAKWGQLPFDFGEAIKSLAEKKGTSGEFVQSTIRAQRTSFPNLNVEWGRIVDESVGLSSMPIQMFRLLVEASVSKRSSCMSSEHRIEINRRINGISCCTAARVREEREQLRRLITDYIQLYNQQLKEATTLIELALWKAKVDESNHASINTDWNCPKMVRDKKRADAEALAREECRVKCGADEVVPSILSWL